MKEYLQNIEEVLKEVAELNNLKYIPPEKREPQVVVYITDEYGKSFVTTVKKSDIKAKDYNIPINEIMKSISQKEGWDFIPLENRGSVIPFINEDKDGDIIISLKKIKLNGKPINSQSSFIHSSIISSFSKDLVAYDQNKFYSSYNVKKNRKKTNKLVASASLNKKHKLGEVSLDVLEKAGYHLLVDENGNAYLVHESSKR